MRAAPDAAGLAVRVIARTWRRVDIAKGPKRPEGSQIKVNAALTAERPRRF